MTVPPVNRSLDDLDVVIGGVSCFGVFLVALLLIAIAPQERAAACTMPAADGGAMPHFCRTAP